MASSQAGIQGLVGGSFHFSGTSGVGTAAAMRGVPLKNVMVFDTRPLFWLYASKKIKTVQDLKGGKVVGISSLGANTDQITREVLLANRIDPRRDVVIQAIGPGGVRLQALLAGSVDATILNPLESLVAKRNGFNEILFYGDYDLGIASGGVIATDRILSERPEFVRRFLRGTLNAFRWFTANEKDATALMAKNFKISIEDALVVYRATLKSLTADGTIPLETQRKIIASQREALKMDKEVAAGKVFDFSILRSLK
jgi:ABC-type nitrate/sulfonate/bicarbonate transport system substrate-binding protein